MNKKKASEKLLKAEKPEKVLSSITDMYVSYDNEWRFVEVNPLAEKLMGKTRKELIGKVLWLVFPQLKETEIYRHYLNAVRDKRTRSFEDYSPVTRQWHEFYLYPGEEGLTVYLRDISERKRAEEAIRKSEAEIKAILNAATQSIFLLDTQGTILALNTTTAERLSRKPSELLGQNIFDFTPAQVVNLRRRKLQEVIRTGKMVRFEDQNGDFWMDSNIYPIPDMSGKVCQLVVFANDISERKRAEKALRRSESRYRILHEILRDAFVQVTMTGRIIEFNDLFCRMLGYSPKELQALTYQDLTPGEWLEMERAIVREQIIPHGYSEVYEKEYRRKDGTIFPVELRTMLSRDEEGRPQSMWAIVRDISERKKAETKLQEYKDSLEVKSKSLEEVNIALKVLLMQGEKDRAELEKTIRSNIDRLVLPYIESLKRIAQTNDQKAHIGILESNLRNIIAPLNRKIDSGQFNLTPRESQIANLIREGWASKDIGKLLRISIRAVEFHRNSIRRKLGLESRKTKLQSALSKLNI